MNKEYGNKVMHYAAQLDTLSDTGGIFTRLSYSIVEESDFSKTKDLFMQLSDINDGLSKEINQVSVSLKNSIIGYFGYLKVKELCENNNESKVDNEKTLPELLEELNNLVGLNKVKKIVSELISYQKVQKLRENRGLHTKKNTMHLAFLGNPGTGKTTVARIVGRVYKKLGLLSKGHFIEVSRTDLIAGYQGQTALKVKEVIERAKGGVLFIDEAYSITENEHSDSYGRECLTELTKALEDYRDDLVVIVAGYTELMNQFFESNPGLKSRFNTFIQFDDYKDEELFMILLSMCKENDYIIDNDLEKRIKESFSGTEKIADSRCANGRYVRNIFEDMVMNHACRVDKIENPTINDLMILRIEDFTSVSYI